MIINQDHVNSRNYGTNVLRTGSGIFHSGMTLNDAKMMGREKCYFKRDFSDVDKNNDGVLSDDEIIKEREVEVKRLKRDGIIFGAITAFDFLHGFVMKRPNLLDLAFTIMFACFSFSSFSSAKKLKAANEELKQQFAVNV